jgi:hypothetical protein
VTNTVNGDANHPGNILLTSGTGGTGTGEACNVTTVSGFNIVGAKYGSRESRTYRLCAGAHSNMCPYRDPDCYPDFLYAAPASTAYATFIKESRMK